MKINEPIYTAVQIWKQRCFIEDASIFGSDAVWTPGVIDEFRVLFVDNAIEGKEDFFTKFERQLRPGTVEVKQFAAEIIWLLYLFPTNIGSKKKQEQILRVWNWSGRPFPKDLNVMVAYPSGIGSAGIAFATGRWREVAYLYRIFAAVKSLQVSERERLLVDPWNFARFVDGIEGSAQRQMRHILLHLAFPEAFERISISQHKELILEAFGTNTADAAAEAPGDLSARGQQDWAIFQVRSVLAKELGTEDFDFYDPGIKERWLPESEKGGEKLKEEKTDDRDGMHQWVISLGENGRLWPECRDAGIVAIGWDQIGNLNQYADREAIREALIESNGEKTTQSNNSLALYEFKRGIQEGDIIYAKVGMERILARGIVESGYLYDASRKEYRNTRKVDWQDTREVSLPEDCRVPLKTLTNVDEYARFRTFVEAFYAREYDPKEGAGPEQRQYWWLNANPKVWDFNSMEVGTTQIYTAYNDNGNKRQKFKHFEAIRPGDLIVGYLTTPTKAVVSFCEVTKGMAETDGEGFEFKKLADLTDPIHWADLQAYPELAQCEPILSNQGSLFKLTTAEFEFIRSIIDERTPSRQIKPYSRADALRDLFMGAATFDKMMALLRHKKNLIIQGAPGVGKTFVARRLAYALMGEKDDERARMIQFHQSYSYEDFIQGYRPDGKGGFRLKSGIFHTFCLRAQRDLDRDYFLVIDEINRGNLSKIFGELLMLIEADKRGTGHQMQLTYAESPDDTFHIPGNVHIIGTMNTADRSLSMVDYALRRRFAFVDLNPEFGSDRFLAQLTAAGVSPDLCGRIIERMGTLNQAIAADFHELGEGYQIGHSFFCPASSMKPDEHWYQFVVEHEIKPLLREYWLDDLGKVRAAVDALLAD